MIEPGRGPRLTVVYQDRLRAHALSAALALRLGTRSLAMVAAEPDALAALAPAPGQLLLVDAGEGGVPLVRELIERHPEARIVAFGLDDEAEAVGAIEAGASAVVLRSEGLGEMLAAIEALSAGGVRCCPRVLAGVAARVAELAAAGAEAAAPPSLTRRERQVLALLAEGMTNKEVAAELEVALPTVKNHVHAVLAKLASASRRQAVGRAYELGLVGSFLGFGRPGLGPGAGLAAAWPPPRH